MAGASPGSSTPPALPPSPLSVSSTTLFLSSLPSNWSTLDLTSSLLFTCQPASIYQPTPTTAFVLFASATSAQQAKRALSSTPPVQAVWAVEVEDGRDVRVTVVEGGSKKLLREEVLKASGLSDSDVQQAGSDALLLSTADVRRLLFAVNRLQCASSAYRFSAVEKQRSTPVKRKSSGFLAELGERTKSANGGLTFHTASSPAATPVRLVSPPPAVAASPPSLPQQPVHSYPSPAMPPPTLPMPPLPPPIMPPAFAFSVGMPPPSDAVFLPPGFLPPPPQPPSFTPPMPHMPLMVATPQPPKPAPTDKPVDETDSAPSLVGARERRSEQDWKRDESGNESRSGAWPERRQETEANGREDRYREHDERYTQHDDRSDRGERRLQSSYPASRRGSDAEREGGRDRHLEYRESSRDVYHREERVAAPEYSERREREWETSGRDDRDRQRDRSSWQPNAPRRWSERDDRRTDDDMLAWRDEPDDRHSHHGGDDRADRWDTRDTGYRGVERDRSRDRYDGRRERRDGSRADSERESRPGTWDDAKDERHNQSAVGPPRRSTSTSKSPYTSNPSPADTPERRVEDQDRANGVHDASKPRRSEDREREESRDNGDTRDRRTHPHYAVDGGGQMAPRQPPPTVAQPLPTPPTTAPPQPTRAAATDEKKDWSAERWQPQANDSRAAPSNGKQTSSTTATRTVALSASSTSASASSLWSSQPAVPPSQRPRSDANRGANGGGQPRSEPKQLSGQGPNAANPSLLRIGFDQA